MYELTLVLENFTHFISLESLALWISQLSAFATRRNINGDKGHPCLKPLVGLKKGEGAPFINTVKEVDQMHLNIHSTTIDMPIWNINNFINV